MHLPAYKTMVDKLSQEVCRNLLGKPSTQTASVNVRQVCERAVVNIVLISNAAIQKLNKQWRAKDAPTDVLSFAITLEPPPAGIPWELGEIFISVETAVRQAQDFNHSLERELAFLTVHGLLHLLGFDHQEPAQEKEMLARQESILNATGYPRQNHH